MAEGIPDPGTSWMPYDHIGRHHRQKWKMPILRNLLSEPNRFSDFERAIPGINSRVLTESLRGLERDGKIPREVGKGVNLPVVYSLTNLGESMRPVTDTMHDWGEAYLSNHQDD